MTLDEIKNLIQQGESNTLEFKRSTSKLDEAAKTLCSFLNQQGGYVIFGVEDKGNIVGQDISDHTHQEIATTLQKFEPHAPIEVVYVPLDHNHKTLVILHASPGFAMRPYAYKGRAYRRLQSSTSQMPQEQYQQLLLEKMQHNQRWESLPGTHVTIEQLDREEIMRTIKKGVDSGRIDPDLNTESLPEALSGMGLMEGSTLFNAAVVLFGTQLKTHYPQCKIRLARFKGTEKNEFIDNKQVTGHAFKLLEEASAFIQRHSLVVSTFKYDQLERVDEPSYPPTAIREALINALIHRDYTIRGGAISVAMYDDRLEIWSDGTLSTDMSFENLWVRHLSKPRNALIADIFYIRKLFEEWGRGTLKIIEQCREMGHPDPEFFQEAGAFCVRLWSKHYEQYRHPLSERQQEILRVLAQAPFLSSREILTRMKHPPLPRILRQDLGLLKKAQLIDTKGFGRGAVWFLRQVHIKE